LLFTELGQIKNVFFIIAITALMAIATTIITFLADLLPSTMRGFSAEAADALAVVVQSEAGH
jgi:hypothetical protein